MNPDDHERFGRATTDARKRVQELIRLEVEADELAYSHDEQHAHLHEWPEPNIERGQE